MVYTAVDNEKNYGACCDEKTDACMNNNSIEEIEDRDDDRLSDDRDGDDE
jgi:hypothetical protein